MKKWYQTNNLHFHFKGNVKRKTYIFDVISKIIQLYTMFVFFLYEVECVLLFVGQQRQTRKIKWAVKP